MSFAHSVGNFVDFGWILAKPARIILGIPLLPAAFFQDCRGIFNTVSAMMMGYRTVWTWYSALKQGKRTTMVHDVILALIGGTLIWPLMIFFDMFMPISVSISNYGTWDKTRQFGFHYPPVPDEVYTGPISTIMFTGPIVLLIVALVMTGLYKLSVKTQKKFTVSEEASTSDNNVEGAESTVVCKQKIRHIILNNVDFIFITYFAIFSVLFSLVIALLRYPVGLGIYNFVRSWGNAHGYPANNNDLGHNVASYINYSWPRVTGNNGQPVPKANYDAFFLTMLCSEISGSLMGFFPYAMHFMPGIILGFLLASFKGNRTVVKDKVRVLWTISSIFYIPILAFFLIWVAIYPPDFKTWVPWRYNGSLFFTNFGLAPWGGVERLRYHTGPYELWLTVISTLAGTVVVHLGEFSKAARRMCRSDNPSYGAMALVSRERGVPLRWLRRCSTYSATAIGYDFAFTAFCLRIFRVAGMPFNESAWTTQSYTILLNFCVILGVLLIQMIIDLVFCGYTSVDFGIQVARGVASAIIVTGQAVGSLTSPKVRSDMTLWRDNLLTMLGKIAQFTVKPLYRNHIGVKFVEFFEPDEKLAKKLTKKVAELPMIVSEEQVVEL